MTRFYRCTAAACRRMWHHTSIAKFYVEPSGLFPLGLGDHPADNIKWCPACGAQCKPEKGLMDEGEA